MTPTHYHTVSLTPTDNYATDTRLWIGSANTCSGLHSDLKDNIFVQISGRKKVYLVPFKQTNLVYPFIDNVVNSMVDPDNVDISRYPNFLKATVYETTVNHGEMLFIPKGWWHYLKSESKSISVNHWFGKPISSIHYLYLIARLGHKHIFRMFGDMLRYSILDRKYRKDFFFTPVSNGERFYNLIRYGNFSQSLFKFFSIAN